MFDHYSRGKDCYREQGVFRFLGVCVHEHPLSAISIMPLLLLDKEELIEHVDLPQAELPGNLEAVIV